MKTYNLPDVVWLDHDLIYNFQLIAEFEFWLLFNKIKWLGFHPN